MDFPEKRPEQTAEAPSKTKGKDTINFLKDRHTEELVIGLCGPAGAGTSSIASEISNIFENNDYEVAPISISKLIKEHPLTTATEGIPDLQKAGNDIRKENGNYHLAELAIKEISIKRDIEDQDAYTTKKSRRHITIIESLKNPEEVQLLKLVYGSMFYLVGVLCHEEKRIVRLTEKIGDRTTALKIIEKDEKEKDDYGQQTSKSLKLADYFVRNESSHPKYTIPSLERFISLILRENNTTPTFHEFGMYLAESASRLSGCMSRQVGAAILSEEGDIVTVGRNDAPAKGGGLYCEKHEDEANQRCMNINGGVCKNDQGKEDIYKTIKDILDKNIPNPKDKAVETILKDIKENTEIKNLLEYSRAVHAEMDAITTAARNGLSVKGATLYTSTFPCHHCARHIVSSGIVEVIYIEPYEKSLAKKLHSDAIDTSDQHSDQKVPFRHFQGVAPKNFLELFYFKSRKKDGIHNIIDKKHSFPKLAAHLDSAHDKEAKIADRLAQKDESQ